MSKAPKEHLGKAFIQAGIGKSCTIGKEPVNILMKNGEPFTEEKPDYKAWVGLLLDKIKNHNEDLQRAKNLQGINPMDFKMGPFMGPRIFYDTSPQEIQLPTTIKEWQEKELESTEEGRHKIGKSALRKLNRQERRVLNLNIPFKEIDAGYLSNEKKKKEDQAFLRVKKEELEQAHQKIRDAYRKNIKVQHTIKYKKMINQHDTLHAEYTKLKETFEEQNRYDNEYFY